MKTARQILLFPDALVRRWKASLIATRVVLVVVVVLVVTPIRKMPKALLIRNGKLRNLAYTFMTSFPPGLPVISY